QTWSGSASDLLRAGAQLSGDGAWNETNGWPSTPRALAGRLRRAQTFLRTLGIEMTFGREGRTGTRTIRISRRKASDNGQHRQHRQYNQRGLSETPAGR